ncbi:hypothetical protein LK09_01810 [Microbacterium mangrovi]|uniref:Uncharacterized protein n=1 Tax=Microbacterium mangrovi TaxID=1348253 RepID=A0A0B2ACD1_9MICO|nr:hypothetical protein [Microbacterium mangrovi]KHK99423.1 hypothetical protein LK09_01810 [Microbacterium mangrovi]
MAMTTRRRRLIGSSVIAAVILTVGVFGIEAANQAAAVQREIPPASASPDQVLDVYLRAAKAHDCAVAAALIAPGADLDPLCGPRNPLDALLGSSGEILDYSRAEGPVGDCYPVDLVETGMDGAEAGNLPGWEFCFVQTPQGWRISDEGHG